MTASVFDHQYLKALLGDEELAAHFSASREIEAMVAIEAAIAKQAGFGIADGLRDFVPDMAALNRASARDGVVVPELVRQLRGHLGAPLNAHVHQGATSQDLIDTALVLRLKTVVAILDSRLGGLIGDLESLIERHGDRPLMARTRMQAALPITVEDRIETWLLPLVSHRQRLSELKPRLLVVQFGGPVGTEGRDRVAGLAKELDLAEPARAWHSMRDNVAELASWLSLVTGSLGKMGQDVALMAQNGIDDITLSDTGGSSAMAGKENPVKAEILVTLARFNATQLAGMHHALVHEQERSGAAWTLEWMILPQMIVAAGASTRTAGELVQSIDSMGGIGPSGEL